MITADAGGTLPSSLRSTHLSLRGERADGGGNAGMLAGAGAGGRGRESGAQNTGALPSGAAGPAGSTPSPLTCDLEIDPN